MADEASLVEQFVAVTGCSEDQARQFLQMTDWQIDAAVSLFMDFPATELPETTTIPEEREEVPLPRQEYRDQLITSHPPSVAEPARVDPNFDSIFHLPAGNFHGSFEEAKAFASSEKKNLLVYVFRTESYKCLAFNRDILRKDLVKEISTSSFVFFVKEDKSEEGQAILRLYNRAFGENSEVTNLDVPNVAIIDPLTGRLLRKFQTYDFENSENFLHRLMENVVLETRTNDKPSAKPEERTPRETKIEEPNKSVETEAQEPKSGGRALGYGTEVEGAGAVKVEGADILKSLYRERQRRKMNPDNGSA